MLAGLMKPEYLLNPRQLIRRLRQSAFKPKQGLVTVRLPWGWPIEVSTDDDIGRSLIQAGVYDLAVSEVLWRLCDSGETALDVGANIGIMSALFARRVGATGRVVCFEAHPAIAGELHSNVARWRGLPGAGKIQVHALALSHCDDVVRLEMPPGFSHNRGASYIANDPSGFSKSGKFVNVPCARLDSFLNQIEGVGMAKMDVEGHEESVLKGASEALQAGRVRDWVFEHYPSYPSPVTAIFEANNYTVLQIEKRLIGPRLVPISQPIKRSAWESPSCLATLDPNRALSRMKRLGWRVMHSA